MYEYDCALQGNSDSPSSELVAWIRLLNWVGSVLNYQIEENMRASGRISRLAGSFKGCMECPQLRVADFES